MKKIKIISEVFYPDEVSTGYIMTKIAEELEKENEVEVFCAESNYAESEKILLADRKLPGKIKINRIKVPNLSKNSSFSRLLRSLWVSFSFTFKLLASVKKEDIVISVTNPITILPFVGFIRSIKNFKLIIVVHDVFPENSNAVGLSSTSSITYKIARYLYNKAYSQADHLVALGEDMKEVLNEKTSGKNKISVISNWADIDLIYPLGKSTTDFAATYFSMPELREKIIILFAGNLGRAQGLEEFLYCFLSSNNPNIALIFLGNGAIETKLKQMVEKSQFSSTVRFVNTKPRSEQINFLNACHIGLVCLNKAMYGLAVPSKSYNIWASEKPVLYIGPKNSQISQDNANYDIGWSFDWDNTDQIIKWLTEIDRESLNEISIKGTNARHSAEKVFRKELIVRKYRAIV